jgi:DnaJ-class molecular chaperone
MTEEWISCPTCHGEGEVDMEWIDGEHFVSGSGRQCPTCEGDMAIEPDDPRLLTSTQPVPSTPGGTP